MSDDELERMLIVNELLARISSETVSVITLTGILRPQHLGSALQWARVFEARAAAEEGDG
jgi:hypothetical protein